MSWPHQTAAQWATVLARVRQLEAARFEVRLVPHLTWNGSQIVNAVLVEATCR